MGNPNDILKTCVDCKFPFTLDNFYDSKLNAGGKSTCCKACYYLRQRKSITKHRERLKSWKKLYTEKNLHTLRRDSRERKKERIAAMTEEEFIEFKRKRQEGKRIHRAKKYGSGGRHNEQQWRELLQICDYKCVACGTTENLSRDHIVPLTLGGSDDIANIQPLCRPCNSSKNRFHTMDYRKNELIPAIKQIGLKKCTICDANFRPLNSKGKYCSKKCKNKSRQPYLNEWRRKHP